MYAPSRAAGDGATQDQQVVVRLLDTTQLNADQEYFQSRANSMQFIETQLHKIDQVG
jgi:hypothetical protein